LATPTLSCEHEGHSITVNALLFWWIVEQHNINIFFLLLLKKGICAKHRGLDVRCAEVASLLHLG